MQDAPQPDQLLAAVLRFLRDEAGPALARSGHSALAYQARVAANMLEIAGRELRLGPAADACELARLRVLLGQAEIAAEFSTDRAAALAEPAAATQAADPTELRRRNQRLTDHIAAGTLGADSPGLTEHLWVTTLAKLAVDQPGYDSYRRAIAAQSEPPDKDR